MSENNYPQGGPANRLPSPNSKYPFVGNNYMQYGEVPGYVYNPWDDQYYLDKGEYTDYLESTGQIEKEPSLTEQLVPVAGSALAVEGGKAIGAELPGLFKGGLSGIKDSVGGLLGVGGSTAPAQTASTVGLDLGLGGAVPEGYGVLAPEAAPASMSSGLMGLAPYAGVAAGLYLGGKGISNYLKGKDHWDPKDDPMGAASRATLGIATGGLSEVARYFGIGRHKSTKQYQDERWGKLSPAAQGLRGANHPEGDDGIWKTGKYAGQKWSFEKARDLATEDPTHFVGVLGNLEAFGDEWLGLPLDKQKEIVSRLNNENLYYSDKGDVLLKNKDRARQIKDEVLSGQSAVITPQTSKDKPAPLPAGYKSPQSSQPMQPAGLLGVGSKVSSGLAFDPNSAQYNALSKEDKNKYWELRNQGK